MTCKKGNNVDAVNITLNSVVIMASINRMMMQKHRDRDGTPQLMVLYAGFHLLKLVIKNDK